MLVLKPESIAGLFPPNVPHGAGCLADRSFASRLPPDRPVAIGAPAPPTYRPALKTAEMPKKRGWASPPRQTRASLWSRAPSFSQRGDRSATAASQGSSSPAPRPARLAEPRVPRLRVRAGMAQPDPPRVRPIPPRVPTGRPLTSARVAFESGVFGRPSVRSATGVPAAPSHSQATLDAPYAKRCLPNGTLSFEKGSPVLLDLGPAVARGERRRSSQGFERRRMCSSAGAECAPPRDLGGASLASEVWRDGAPHAAYIPDLLRCLDAGWGVQKNRAHAFPLRVSRDAAGRPPHTSPATRRARRR